MGGLKEEKDVCFMIILKDYNKGEVLTGSLTGSVTGRVTGSVTGRVVGWGCD